MRRRGIPPEAINNFCAQLGVTGAQSTVDPSMLDAFVRDHLNNTAPRYLFNTFLKKCFKNIRNFRVMAVLEPLKITITNFPHKESINVEVPNFPNKPEMGSHKVAFDKVIYIEKSDFMETGDKGYRRLTKAQHVGLRHAGFVLQCSDVRKNSKGEIEEILCKCIEVEKAAQKPKAFIHWVSKPIEIEVRMYEPLFKHKNPEDAAEVPQGYLSDCNLNSLNILNSLADVSLSSAKTYDKFQFERLGFFSVDPDSTKRKVSYLYFSLARI